jgi:hypothetical protein
MKNHLQPNPTFLLEKEYNRCFSTLNHTGLLSPLPCTKRNGVIGVDGIAYPIPTLNQMAELFEQNKTLIDRKISQGFDRLQLTPIAMPLPRLIDRLKAVILERAAEGKIYQTRRSPADPLMPVRVNPEKTVWVWDTLDHAINEDELVYFPQEYSSNHQGHTKQEVIHDEKICAVPGWSVGLIESLPMLPQRGEGQTIGGRKQLEIGYSPREYLQLLKMDNYEGETGNILEDFIVKFLSRLEATNEISNDRVDNNSMWCLGQYLRIDYAELVPTGWWHREFGRLRLDMHRTGNKRCTKSWGASTSVRLSYS